MMHTVENILKNYEQKHNNDNCMSKEDKQTMQASSVDNTTNQYLEVNNYNIENEIQKLPVIASNANKNEH